MAAKQAKFDAEALNEQFNAVKDGHTFPGTIREIEQKKAFEVFGEGIENPNREVIVMQVEVNDGEFFGETMTLPKSAGSWKRENFRLGQFARKYGSVPYVGQKVEIIVNSEGYYRIAV